MLLIVFEELVSHVKWRTRIDGVRKQSALGNILTQERKVAESLRSVCNFHNYTIHQVLLEWRSQRGKMGRACSTH
jgi:hypothetical protein